VPKLPIANTPAILNATLADLPVVEERWPKEVFNVIYHGSK
jgi:hypothetical protein